MSNWKSAGITLDGQAFRLGGLNVWKHQWIPLDEPPVELPHPNYPSQLHQMWLYEMKEENKTVRFAAGELSASVWGFYVPA